jgi:hypothetical protein
MSKINYYYFSYHFTDVAAPQHFHLLQGRESVSRVLCLVAVDESDATLRYEFIVNHSSTHLRLDGPEHLIEYGKAELHVSRDHRHSEVESRDTRQDRIVRAIVPPPLQLIPLLIGVRPKTKADLV